MAEVDGPATALALVDALDLDGYYLFHAIRADLLRRLGRDGEAATAYDGGDRTDRQRRGARLPAPAATVARQLSCGVSNQASVISASWVP